MEVLQLNGIEPGSHRSTTFVFNVLYTMQKQLGRVTL